MWFIFFILSFKFLKAQTNTGLKTVHMSLNANQYRLRTYLIDA
jgi:hypothetical protein